MTYFNRQDEWKFYAEQLFSLTGNLRVNSNLDLGGNLYLNNNWIKDTSGITFSDGTLLTTGNISSSTVNEGNIISDLTLIKAVLEYYFHNIDICGNQQYVTAEELNINGNIRGNNFIGSLYGNIYNNHLFIDTSSVNIKNIMNIDENNSIALGISAGAISQGSYCTAIGSNSGFRNQGMTSVAIGYNSGKNDQSGNAVAIGAYSGNNQGYDTVSVGTLAGWNSQGHSSVAIGKSAGTSLQGNCCTAIGKLAGAHSQGKYSTAIGYFAGFSSQPDNTIIINAKSTALNGINGNGFYVAPIAKGMTSNYLYYDTTSEQIMYEEKIIMSVKKTGSNTVSSGPQSLTKIINWDEPHVNIGPSGGWNTTDSKYVVQRTGTYRMSFKIIISNLDNPSQSLRYVNGGLYIYNSSNILKVHDNDTTILYNVTDSAVERGSLDITTIRTMDQHDYVQIEISLLELTGDYVVESGLLCIEQIN